MTFDAAEGAGRDAHRLVRDLLGIEKPTLSALLVEAKSSIGSQRTAMCIECLRETKLTRRGHDIANLAGVVVGVRALGEPWWQQKHRRYSGPTWDKVSPDDLLRSRRRESWATTLDLLGCWAADDAADALWGAPIDTVDLNSMRTTNRIALPPGARVGDRVVLTFDPGSRVDAIVVVGVDGTMGSELDLASVRHSPPAEAAWAWGISTAIGPHRLPDEDGPSDPYAAPVDASVAARLRLWALEHGLDESLIAPVWCTVGDVIAAIVAANLHSRDGSWFGWGRAMAGVADGERGALEECSSTE